MPIPQEPSAYDFSISEYALPVPMEDRDHINSAQSPPQVTAADNSSEEWHTDVDSSETTIDSNNHDRDASQGNVKLERTTAIALQDPLLAVALFIGSILTAVGHHLYYASMNGTPVDSEDQQIWVIRIGTGLAFLTRSGLSATLAIVAVQQTWVTLRKRAMTIEGIDCMFGVMSNPWLFLNKDLLLHAKRLCVLAAISWLVYTP